MSATRYDTIGQNYPLHRQPDPRITAQVERLLALSPGSCVADIGAGTGNYARELARTGYRIKAIEPSAVMREQAPPHELVEWFAGTAESLPLPDASVDGIMCIHAIYHFNSRQQAVREMVRVCPTGSIVFFVYDPRLQPEFWFQDYFPTVWQNSFQVFPSIEVVADEFAQATGRRVEIVEFPIPGDLQDKFAACGWRNPEIYLDPEIRRSIAVFALSERERVETEVLRLQSDLDNGTWEAKYGGLRNLSVYDAGYRFLCLR